ncbi:unnamed protein product, partial [Pylaiella littoralis]
RGSERRRDQQFQIYSRANAGTAPQQYSCRARGCPPSSRVGLPSNFFRSRQAPHNCQDTLRTSLCRRRRSRPNVTTFWPRQFCRLPLPLSTTASSTIDKHACARWHSGLLYSRSWVL